MSWLDSIADLQAKVAALTAENERLREALGTAANRLDIAANVIRSGAEFVRWAAEARAAIAPTEEAL